MIPPNSLVAYKNKPALARDIADKITLVLADKTTVRVREKDVELLHKGPVDALPNADAGFSPSQARELWELVSGESGALTAGGLAALSGLGDTPAGAWAAYLLLKDGVYFAGTSNAMTPKSVEDVQAREAARARKATAEGERAAFLSRLTTRKLTPDDERFVQDVVALALGKSEKSRTMREANLAEDPIVAHRLLLETGIWNVWVNPAPARDDVSMATPTTPIDAAPTDESRTDLTALSAWAIDDDYSDDPDDALSFERTPEGDFLYVHVADPAASIAPDSPADKEARMRGATFYAPEGVVRMLTPEALPMFALGLTERSNALTFKMRLAQNGNIQHTDVFRSVVRVTRLTYKNADNTPALAELFECADRNITRRVKNGAVMIEFPETHITARDGVVTILPLENYRSRALVRECMLLAGEGVGQWALENRLPFPFIAQEVESTGEDILPGLAGAYQLRRTMRGRILGVKPGLHQGLGLDIYTQVTSPLRRYTDLLCHEQISAFLRGEAALNEDELLARVAGAERAGAAVSRAERDSKAHYIAVYLHDKIGVNEEGIVMDRRGPHIVVLLPALGLETQTALPRGADIEPNDRVTLTLSSVRIPECETSWILA
jgi:exoribonuclease-2